MGKDCKSLDALIVHVPARAGEHYFVMRMAVGLVPICESLRAAGHRAEIVHLGLEYLRDRSFSLARHVDDSGVKLVGFSVQWHWQLGPVLEEARSLKKTYPEVSIVFGGMTASFFADQIIDCFGFVDYVVRGDAELPLARLLDELGRTGDLSKVPNLVWRQKGRIKANPVSYVPSSADLSSLTYGASDAIRLLDSYLRTGVEDDIREPVFLSEPAVTICTGRGCVHTCSFCSGSCTSMMPVMGRSKPAWIDSRTIHRTMAGCSARGIKHFYLSADIGLREVEFCSLMDRFRAEGRRPRVDVEAWTLPSKAFLEAYQRSVDPRSRLILSPTCGSEEIRRRNRSCFFSNQDYERVLACADDLGLGVWLYFSLGLPFETADDITSTRNWQEGLVSRFPCIERIETQPQHLEPGSPMFLDPERYGVELMRRDCGDFAACGPLDGVGYGTRHFSASEIENIAREWEPYAGL